MLVTNAPVMVEPLTEPAGAHPGPWSAYDVLPAGVVVTTPDGIIVYANPKLHAMLGREAGALAGCALTDLDDKDGAPPPGAGPGQPPPPPPPARERKDGRERRWRRADGSVAWVAVALAGERVTDPDGQPLDLRVVTEVTGHRRLEAGLRDQLLMKDVLFEALPVPVFVKDGEGRYVDCNSAFERYTGLDRKNIVNRTIFNVADGAVAQLHAAMDRDLMVNWGSCSYEHQVPHADKQPRMARISKTVFRDSQGEFGGIVGIIHDVSDGQPNEARLQTILEQSPIGVSVSRRDDGVVVFVNTRFAELIGMARERIVGSKARDFYLNEQQRAKVVERLKTAGSVVNMEVQFKKADGSSFWTLFTVNQAVIHGMPVNLAWIYDYTERRNMEESLRDMASKDPLTGILNRRSFMDLARQQVARAHRFDEPLSVLVLDIDHFKNINDTYGHSTGDEALRMVAGACCGILREYDLLGRLGGEEFVVMLPGVTADEARVVAERLRRSLSRMAIPCSTGRFHLTASIGIAAIDGPADTVEKTIHRADLGLYRAKRQGRNRVIVYEAGMVLAG
jgi:diguanylate cyclase (GGDEF)-like protein/PAS domain S-box-containing protein